MGKMMKVLLINSEPSWSGASRISKALMNAGFSVSIIAGKGSYLSATKYRDLLIESEGFSELSLSKMILHIDDL